METRIALECEENGKVTRGYALRRDFTSHERLVRALKICGILWTVACMTIVVPILHFILPPLFFLLGLFFGTTTWLEKGQVLEGKIHCPNCDNLIVIGRETEGWPRAQRCPSCQMTQAIRPGSGEALKIN